MELSILIDTDGTVTFPSLSAELLPVAAALDPAFDPRDELTIAAVPPSPRVRYRETSHVPVALGRPLDEVDERELWRSHRQAPGGPTPGRPPCSRLDLKIELARRLLRSCGLCPWNCGVDRLAGQRGFCGLGREAYYSGEWLHYGEEAAIRPSHTVFLTGCSLRCVYCVTGESVEAPREGRRIVAADLAARIAARVREGARSISFVGGNPDQNILPILETLRACAVDTPVVWNSNLYCSSALMELLEGVVDVHVADLKYGGDDCARRCSGVARYWETVTANLVRAARDAELIVRHLALPGHRECCTEPLLRWVARALPGVAVNVMGQYRPHHRAIDGPWAELRERLRPEEARAAREFAVALGVNVLGEPDGENPPARAGDGCR
jgi:putative pyruvate formate lyase activating enzyme